ncbi:IS3 family transposase [Microbulbifer sp. EKSA008]|uniref:IS3 family transposase n=1 Tax=unclassified Microbulbifer TaxID=2619833 RepID=UPI00403A4E2B
MSRQANCWDNTAMKSFFSRLKVELVYAGTFEREGQAKSEVFEYIEISTVGFVSTLHWAV